MNKIITAIKIKISASNADKQFFISTLNNARHLLVLMCNMYKKIAHARLELSISRLQLIKVQYNAGCNLEKKAESLLCTIT